MVLEEGNDCQDLVAFWGVYRQAFFGKWGILFQSVKTLQCPHDESCNPEFYVHKSKDCQRVSLYDP